MAKSRGSHTRTRDVSNITTRPRVRSFTPRSSAISSDLTTIEDLRRFQPRKALYVPRKINSLRSRVVLRKVLPSRPRSHRPKRTLFGFQAPQRVLICVRRNIRKQVLHAFKKTGRRGQRRPRRTAYSQISCRG